ncbi:hypothetical protein OA528_01835 [Gammaproteobacteria bacterium]|nr:hypothetical protein [Gammaproteobacteria bacterium]
MLNDKIQKTGSEIEASSRRWQIEVGHLDKDPDLIDAINEIFAMFQVNYHNQYYSAFGDSSDSENLAKKLWLSKLNEFSSNILYSAAEKIITESEYLPTLNKMIQACVYFKLPSRLPSPRDAYHEACRKESPKNMQTWSHPIVYLAGRDTGWLQMHSEIDAKVFPIFNNVFQKYCKRLVDGESFSIDAGPQSVEVIEKPASKKFNIKQLEELNTLFE